MCSELWDLQLVQKRPEMLRQVESPKHLISTTTRHPSQHSTTRQHCLHTGLTGLGQGETAQNVSSSFFLNKRNKLVSRDFSGYCRKLLANVLCQHTLCHTHSCPCPMSRLGREMLDTGSTLLVHCLTVLMSSWMTRSIHLRQGVFSLTICFFTMTSNARSGVNSPVLRMHRETEAQQQTDGTVNRHVG